MAQVRPDRFHGLELLLKIFADPEGILCAARARRAGQFNRKRSRE
jgi:hypothetical protein